MADQPTKSPELFDEVYWVEHIDTAMDSLWLISNPDGRKILEDFRTSEITLSTSQIELIASKVRNLATIFLKHRLVVGWQEDLRGDCKHGGPKHALAHISVIEHTLRAEFPGIPLTVEQFLNQAREYVEACVP